MTSALDALVAEFAALDRGVDQAIENEEAARLAATQARQGLDAAAAVTKDRAGRRDATGEAIRIIQGRDEIADQTVERMLEQAGRPRTWE